MLFLDRLPGMPEEYALLAGLGLVEETYRAAAQVQRGLLVPTQWHVSGQVERVLWEASPAAQAQVTCWVGEEIDRFVAGLPDPVVARDSGDLPVVVEQRLEALLEAQRAHDPTGRSRAESGAGLDAAPALVGAGQPG